MNDGQQRFRVMVTDEVDPEGIALLREVPEIEVVERPTRPIPEVLEEIDGYDALIGRSATRISRELLEKGTRLKVVGRAGVGVDNVDVERATELGIAVINAPGGNTISVAELVYGVLISYFRHVHIAFESMRAGEWRRSKLGGAELRGRTLLIIGVGRIGSEVARRGHAFGLKLIGYDPYVSGSRFEELGIERIPELHDALEIADIVTLHVPLTDETQNMLGAEELAKLGPDSIVLNFARGGIIDEDALVDVLQSGKIRAAILDVFASEPLAKDHPLRHMDNVLLTPHLGASTAEAQRNVALEACAAVRDALLTGDLSAAINAAGVGGAALRDLQPLLQLSERLGRLGRTLLDGGLSGLELRYAGSRPDAARPLLLSALQGAMQNVLDSRAVNLVNAQHVAAARGVETAWTQVSPQHDLGEEVELRLKSGDETMRVGGSLLGEAHGRITRIGAFRVDIAPRGTLLVLRNRDVPGVIGRVGTLLGEAGVNIAEYHQARIEAGGEALAAVQIDTPISNELLDQLCDLPDMRDAKQVVME